MHLNQCDINLDLMRHLFVLTFVAILQEFPGLYVYVRIWVSVIRTYLPLLVCMTYTTCEFVA